MALLHSNGVYSGMKLWHEDPDRIKSLVMFHPAGHRPMKSMQPAWLLGQIVKMNLTPWGRKLYYAISKPILKMCGMPLDVNNLETIMFAGQAMFLARGHRLNKYLPALREKKTPTMFLFAEKDKLVDTKISYEMAEKLGAKKEQMDIYNGGELVQEGSSKSDSEWLKVVNFRDGGHFAFAKNNEVVHHEVETLLNKVVKARVPEAAVEISEKDFTERLLPEDSSKNVRVFDHIDFKLAAMNDNYETYVKNCEISRIAL